METNFKAKIRYNRVYNTDGTKASIRPFRKGDTAIPPLKHFESDRGRILNSAAIRRLQQKTQVFPLERNSAVRSRLTHSLEVQQVGRFINQMIFKQLSENNLLETYGLEGMERQMESIVEMSCLMHDIGNPPFGHFGEAAINDWLRDNLRNLLSNFENSFPENLIKDLCNFEGNAQAIRIVHTLLGLNLTYAQVSGILKYTRRGDQDKPDSTEPKSYLYKKVGHYLSEQQYISDLKKTLSMKDGCRSPFSYIMEAADDISYGLADLEDAVEKGILDIEKLGNLLKDEYSNVTSNFENAESDSRMETIVKKAIDSANRANNCRDAHFFITLRVEISHPLVLHASKQFINNIDDIFNGEYNGHLLENHSNEHALVETLKNIAIKHAFCDKEVELREIQGYKIISNLLDTYSPLLKLTVEEFSDLVNGVRNKAIRPYLKHLFNKLPNKHVRAYQVALKRDNTPLLDFDINIEYWEFYCRTRLIIDYISGMTDQYALDEYRSLNVIDF